MDFGEDGVTISHLSAQLIAHGLLNRPLDFEQLFLAPPSAPASILSSSSDTDKDRRTYERALRHYSRQHAGAVSHALRALWETLSQYSAQHDSLERVSARVRTLEFELKRQREIAKVEKDRADRLNKEKEAEKAATKKAEMERDAERDRLKLTRDELGRAKQSLQFVKSQTQHEQKRRDIELAAATARFQRLSSADLAHHRVTVLNSESLRRAAGSSGSSLTTSSIGPRRATASPATAAEKPVEVVLLDRALSASRDEVNRLSDEMSELARFVDEVDDWVGDINRVLKDEGLVAVLATTSSSLSTSKTSRSPWTYHASASAPSTVLRVGDDLFHLRCRLHDVLSRARDASSIARAEALKGTDAERAQLESRVVDAERESKALMSERDQLASRLAGLEVALAKLAPAGEDQDAHVDSPAVVVGGVESVASSPAAAGEGSASKGTQGAAESLSEDKKEKRRLERAKLLEQERASKVASFLDEFKSPPASGGTLHSIPAPTSSSASPQELVVAPREEERAVTEEEEEEDKDADESIATSPPPPSSMTVSETPILKTRAPLMPLQGGGNKNNALDNILDLAPFSPELEGPRASSVVKVTATAAAHKTRRA